MSYAGIDLSLIKNIYLVITTVVPVPQCFGVSALIENEVAANDYLKTTMQLQILTAEDIEMLLPSMEHGLALSDLLASKNCRQILEHAISSKL